MREIARNVLLEKHWRVVVSRQVVSFFIESARKLPRVEELLPVLSMQNLLLVHVIRGSLIYLAVVSSEGARKHEGKIRGVYV